MKKLLILALLITSVFAASAMKASTSSLSIDLPTVTYQSNEPIYSKTIQTNLIGRHKLIFTIVPHGQTQKADIYIKENGAYHRVAEIFIADPNIPTEHAIVAENVKEVLIHMPDSENPIVNLKTFATTEPPTILATETCNNDIGYSPNPTECHCKASGYKDCCGWYQQYHVHDLQTNITDPVDIFIDFRIGFQQGCTDNVTVYTSDDNATWVYAGSTTATALDLDGNPVFPQAWSTHTFAIKNYTTPFRYIKISAPKCFNDWSYVTITNASNNTAPTAVLKAPQKATVGKKVVFDATGSYDDQPLTYIWKFGDHSGTTTSVPIVSHTYSDGYYWNGTWYPFTIPQTLTVELRVSDGAASSIDTAQITLVSYDVDNPPVAYFTYSVENSTITLNASLSDDDNQITSYDWDFGDGNTGTGETVAHTYAAEGNYTVTLMVTDNSTQTDTYQETVEILTVTDTTPPTVNITSPSAAVYNTTELVLEFTVQDSSVDTCTYSLNGVDEGPAGNGTNITAAEGPNSLTVYCNDTYGNIGSDTVDFTVDTEMLCNYTLDSQENQTNATNATLVSMEFTLDEGEHNITIQCYDGSNWSPLYFVNWTQDWTLPELTITSPANESVFFDTNNVSLYYNTSEPLQYTCAMLDISQQPAPDYHFGLCYDIDGNTYWRDPNNSPTAFKNLEDGIHTLSIFGMDYAGYSSWPINITIYVRLHDPITDIVSPENYTETNDSFVLVTFNSSAAFLQGFEYSYDNVSWYDMGYSAVPDTNYDWNFRIVLCPSIVIYQRGCESRCYSIPAVHLPLKFLLTPARNIISISHC